MGNNSLNDGLGPIIRCTWTNLYGAFKNVPKHLKAYYMTVK